MSSQLLPQQAGLRLAEILPQCRFIGADHVDVASCSGQWDECQPGDVYVAICDCESDGHEFAGQAVANGAVAVVTERLLAISVPQCIVSDTRLAYASICQALAGTPSQRIISIGVGGSDGKTVTSHLIQSVLEAGDATPGVASSIDVRYGRGEVPIPSVTPRPPVIADQLAQMVLKDCTHAVLEIPGRSLARHDFAGVNLDVAVVTNIRASNLELHGSNGNYRRTQSRLLRSLKPTGLAVLNLDDSGSQEMVDAATCPTLTISMMQDADVTAKLLDRQKSEQTFLLTAGEESVPVCTKMIGDHHIYNCLAATAVGLSQGLCLATIARGLQTGSALPGRMERVECGQDFGVWVDSAQSPNQLARGLAAVREVVKGNVWCVSSVGEDRTPQQRRRMGEVLERSSDHAVITRSTGESIADYEPLHQIVDGFETPGDARMIPNRFRAIEWVLEQARPGDAVVIAGCGERPFAIVGEHNWTIGDRDVCQAWLYDNASLIGEQDEDEAEPEIYRIDDYRC